MKFCILGPIRKKYQTLIPAKIVTLRYVHTLYHNITSYIASHVGRHRLGGDMKLQILPIPYLLSLVNVNECLILSVPPTTPRHGWRPRAPPISKGHCQVASVNSNKV